MKNNSHILTTLAAPFVALTLTFVAAKAWSKVAYDAGQLLMKNSDQVTDIVREKIKSAGDIEAKASDADGTAAPEPEAIEDLTDALRIALSRPDQDGLRGILVGRIRRETDDLLATDSILKGLADEGISSLKSKGPTERLQATYIVMLENLMAEIRPEAETKPAFKAIIESIRDAKIKINSALKMDETLGLMKTPISPSDTAAEILKADKNAAPKKTPEPKPKSNKKKK
jgi:hypothetical protein